jgi:hypothetical protein
MRVSFYFERSCPEQLPRAPLKPQEPRSSGPWTPGARRPRRGPRESWSRGRGVAESWQAAGAGDIFAVGKAVLTLHPPLRPLSHNVNPRDGAQDIRGHHAPVTTSNRRAHRDTHHRCSRMCKRSNLPPASRGPVQPPQSFNYELGRSGCDTRPLRRNMSFATSVAKVVLTRCVQHLPPYPLTRRPHAEPTRTSQDRQLANARVAEADAPSHHYNRSKPRKLLAIQQGGVIGIASESKGRDI